MSEYIGGPLDVLAELFMEALRENDPLKKAKLIDKWNEKIKFLNSVLKVQDMGCSISHPVDGRKDGPRHR